MLRLSGLASLARRTFATKAQQLNSAPTKAVFAAGAGFGALLGAAAAVATSSALADYRVPTEVPPEKRPTSSYSRSSPGVTRDNTPSGLGVPAPNTTTDGRGVLPTADKPLTDPRPQYGGSGSATESGGSGGTQHHSGIGSAVSSVGSTLSNMVSGSEPQHGSHPSEPQHGSHPGSPHVPGEQTTLMTKSLEMGSNLMQSFKPVNKIHEHVCGFHFYDGNIKRQVEAHHYCSHLNEEFRQCVIYDSDRPDAKLIGVEYLISERLFESLPEEEKKYWHSHAYEVKSGILVAPGVPEIAEKQMMKTIINTYGKTWHTWQIDRDALPLGAPSLMQAFTADGQLYAELVENRDKREGINSFKKRQSRQDLIANPVNPKADAWQHGASALRAQAAR